MITELNSRVYRFEEEGASYITSTPLHMNPWGQPPLSYYEIVVVDNLIHGRLIEIGQTTADFDDLEEKDEELKAEFDIWEAASNEDWLNFESGLD